MLFRYHKFRKTCHKFLKINTHTRINFHYLLSYDENLHTFSYLLFSTFAEYEGSPRRIGQMGNNSNNDEDHHHHHRANSKLQTNVINKTNHHNVISTTSTGGATANNSPKQHYAARPGFPQVSFLFIYETRKADGRTVRPRRQYSIDAIR